MAHLREAKRQGLREFFLERVRQSGETVFSATYQEIAAQSGVSLGTVVKGLKILEREGFIQIKKGASRRIPNAYAVLTSPDNRDRTLGEELGEYKGRLDESQRMLARLRRQLEGYERFYDAFITRKPLPGDLMLAIYPAYAEEAVVKSRAEERDLLKRLLDRRGIGAALRRLGKSPTPKAAKVFSERARRRLRAHMVHTLSSPQMERVYELFNQYLIPLPEAENLPAAIQEAYDAYEDVLAKCLEDPAGASARSSAAP